MKPTLIIFAKSPRMGVAKTRLAAGIGSVRAWQIKRELDRFTCQTAIDPRWTTILAVAPERDIAADFGGAWPRHLRRIGQGRGNLGQRMARATRHFCQSPIIIIGSDAPGLLKQDIWAGFQALKRHDVVFGPALDGGYWLIGHAPRAARRTKLDQVRWSTEHTLADSIAALPRNWSIGRLREQADIDDVQSLKALKIRSRQRLP